MPARRTFKLCTQKNHLPVNYSTFNLLLFSPHIMNKFLSSLMALASLTTVFALQFENKTCTVGECLSIAYQSHSALLEQRVRANATSPITGFSEESYLKH